MRKLAVLGAAAAALVTVAVASPADAITRGGVPDGDQHPYVGVVRSYDENDVYLGRCSGALIDATTFVTAGHCTEGAARSELWFTSDLEPIAETAYPESPEATGTPYTHPLYLPQAFFVYDLGVVILDAEFPLPTYASLPSIGRVDQFGTGRNSGDATVTAVGYGLQKIVESAQGVGQDFVVNDVTRYRADLMVTNTNGVAGLGRFFKAYPGSGSFTVSGDAKHGGTCFGDSGGPMLADDTTIVAVNSFGLNGNCAGIGGVYRIDQADDLDFIACLRAEVTHDDRVEHCKPGA